MKLLPSDPKPGYLIFFFLLLNFVLYSQTILIKGIVKEEQTLKPLSAVNIKLFETSRGTSTDASGHFSIQLEKIPAGLIFSCIGYENTYYKITEISKGPVDFLLKSKSYTLKEVNINSQNYSFLFSDKDYSVFDYEVLNGNLLLLIFRTQLKQSQIVVLDRSGDTLAINTLPELPPSGLVKDFLLNVHYFSKNGNAFQCFYNENDGGIGFPYKTTVDSLQNMFKSLIFKISDRIYFQETQAGGFGTAFGFLQKGKGKKYIRKYRNEKKLSEYASDQQFYSRWNDFIARQIPAGDEEGQLDAAKFARSPKLGQYMNKFDVRAYQFEFYKMIFPVIKINDNLIAFFNFGEDEIEIMNKDGKILKVVPITFHKEKVLKSDTISRIRLSDAGWRWGNAILADEYNNSIYTTYINGGMVRINRIDLETGKLIAGTVIPVLFPEKIELYNGEAYFLNKRMNENIKLAKCRL